VAGTSRNPASKAAFSVSLLPNQLPHACTDEEETRCEKRTWSRTCPGRIELAAADAKLRGSRCAGRQIPRTNRSTGRHARRGGTEAARVRRVYARCATRSSIVPSLRGTEAGWTGDTARPGGAGTEAGAGLRLPPPSRSRARPARRAERIAPRAGVVNGFRSGARACSCARPRAPGRSISM
jgi:hypothetical protein